MAAEAPVPLSPSPRVSPSSIITGCSGSLLRSYKRRTFLGNRLQQHLLWIGEFLNALFHEDGFHFCHIDLRGDLVEHIFRRQLIDLSGKTAATFGYRVVRGGRIRFDIAAGESRDVFPRRIL